ncbi:MIP/aquaporin family protein [Peredibacter starrii]|uniref:MIP/aquaporin family protein n=1 Tax=Peredibacter starrii TaxID=28202 RepID=A0AAX4HMD0_9BACT|nr:MIP/aquaporin family protein [Peredibacter starrii]WPU64366.1 MIP/aquaporin family protein [Peredibacter starrii]
MKAKIVSEFLGTAFLVMIVLGSGIMGQNLFPGQVGLALLANSLATGAGLFVLIQCLGPISGAHINPVVSLVEMLWGQIDRKLVVGYILAQMAGAYLGVILTHVIFQLPVFQLSEIERLGSHLLLSEVIATFGLICTIALAGKKHVEFAPMSVAAYITSAYWFTSSTSFANPAVTFARNFTNSFGGMAINHYLPFVAAQLLGAIVAWVVLRAIPQT